MQISTHIATLIKADFSLFQKKFFERADKYDIKFLAESLLLFENVFTTKILEKDPGYNVLCFALQ